VTDTIDDARRLIESRLAEISAEVGGLERALTGLQEGGPRGRRPGRPAKVARSASSGPTRPAVRGRRAAGRVPRGRRREELLAALEDSPGARPSELAKMMGVRPTQVSVLIAKARGEKLIVRRGQGYALRS